MGKNAFEKTFIITYPPPIYHIFQSRIYLVETSMFCPSPGGELFSAHGDTHNTCDYMEGVFDMVWVN